MLTQVGKLKLCLITLALGVGTLRAQFIQMPEGANTQLRYAASVSYAWPSTLHQGSRDLGDMDTVHWRASAGPAFRASERFIWFTGVEAQGFHFDIPSGAPVPEDLYGAALRLGSQWQFAEKWTLVTQISPGLYSDFTDIDGGDVNVPVFALLEYKIRPELQLYFGAGVDFRRDIPVIPLIGARWEFAERWTLQAAFPQPRVEYRLNDDVAIYAGLEYLRSSFRVGEHFGDRVGRPELNDEEISYSQWGVGAGARWRVVKPLLLFAEAGWLVDRRFHYDDRDLLLNGDGAPYLRGGLNGTF